MTVTNLLNKNIARQLISKEVSIAPLVIFRIIFGLVMLISILRFAAKGWIDEFYIQPEFHFAFFDWIKVLPATGMYLAFFIMGVSAFMIMIGLFYRYAAVVFFLLFTYVELIDKTYYLNHYYFISIISFLLILVPANRYLSIDAKLNPSILQNKIPAWTINIFKLQLGIVYFYAGLAKINPDWLFEALPLKIWLPARAYYPIVGDVFKELWVAYAFSWAGMLYDLAIPFLLIKSKTRPYAYAAVVFFHIMTRILFPIGMFPFIMIGLTLIFFSEKFHEKLISYPEKWFSLSKDKTVFGGKTKPAISGILAVVLILHFSFQLLFPLRNVLYPGKLFWTEQGYRFSWRVMLMEKAGMCEFFIKEKENSQYKMIDNSNHLSHLQERMMATQPDMILQYALYLKEKYQTEEIYTESRVTLQGKRSKTFVNPEVNLAGIERSWKHKNWIVPFENAQ